MPITNGGIMIGRHSRIRQGPENRGRMRDSVIAARVPTRVETKATTPATCRLLLNERQNSGLLHRTEYHFVEKTAHGEVGERVLGHREDHHQHHRGEHEHHHQRSEAAPGEGGDRIHRRDLHSESRSMSMMTRQVAEQGEGHRRAERPVEPDRELVADEHADHRPGGAAQELWGDVVANRYQGR